MDKRLIDANALPVHSKVIKHNSGEFRLEYVLADDVREAPSVDAVEVIRCKDCVNRGTPYSCPMRKLVMPVEGPGAYEDCTEDMGFCHMGKRKAILQECDT